MILVVGATGLVGGDVCRRLAASGTAVRALVRATSDPARVAALEALGVETVVGDLRDPASLAEACRDASAVICTASSMPFGYEPGSTTSPRPTWQACFTSSMPPWPPAW